MLTANHSRSSLFFLASVAAAAASAALLAAGCGGGLARVGGGGGGGVVYRFPDRDALRQIAAQPADHEQAFRSGPPPVASWELIGSLPEEVGETLLPESDPAHAQILAHAPGRSLRPTVGMRCFAEQLGRFYLSSGEAPPDTLTRYLAARCGAHEASLPQLFRAGDLPEGATEEQLRGHVEESLTEMLGGLPSATREVGIFWGHDNGRFAILVVGGIPAAQLGAVRPLADASGAVRIEGRLLREGANVTALINQGSYGVRLCVAEAGVEPPRFAFRCPMAEGDPAALIQLLATEQGRALSSPVSMLLARRAGAEGRHYQTVELPPISTASTSNERGIADAILASLNRVRAGASLQPLRLEEGQSRIASAISPHFFLAQNLEGEQAELRGVADQIGLGLLAGWEVPGPIRGGHFTASIVYGSQDPARWLVSALSQPVARLTLLDPEARSIAFGGILGEQGIAALAVSYRFFESDDHSQEARALARRIAHERRARQLPATRLVRSPASYDRIASRVREGRDPSAVLQQLLSDASQRSGRGVSGVVMETADLEQIQLPEQLYGRTPLRFSVVLTHREPPGSAWAQYTVFLLVYQ